MTTANDTPEVRQSGGAAEQYAALRDVATAMARGVDPESMFAVIAERAARLIGGDGGGVVRFDSGGNGRLVGQWSREGLLDGPIPRDIVLTGGSTASQVYQTGRAARVDDYAALDEDRGQYLATAYTSGVAVPIQLGLDVWGAIVVAAANGAILPAEAEATLADFAEIVSLAVASPDPNSRVGIEALLETLLVSAPVGIAFLDRDLRLVRVNNAFAEITGLRSDQHAGRAPADDPARYPHLDAGAVQRVRATGVPVLGLEIAGASVVDPHELRYWLTSYYPVWLARGSLFGVGAVVVDLTEQRRAAEALRRERDYSAAVIGAMQDGVAVADLNGTLIDVSSRFCEMTGFTRGEVVGCSPPYPFWQAGDRHGRRAMEVFTLAIRGETGDHDLLYRRRDGTSLPVFVSHAPLRDADGNVSGLVATVRDVTDLRRAEDERAKLFAAERSARARTEILQQVSAALSKALTPEHVLDVIIARTVPLVGAVGGTVVLDQDDAIIPALRSSHRLLVGKQTPPSLLTDSLFAGVARTGTPVFLSTRSDIAAVDPHADQVIRADANALAVVAVGQGGRMLGALAFGFNDEREFEREDRALLVTLGDLCGQALDRAGLYDSARARAEALRQRDALRTAVLRGVSHEFRSPLTAIANAADALARIEDRALREDLLAVVATETRRLDRFVANVLDFSRLEGGALEPRLDSCTADELTAGALEAVGALVGDVAVAVDLPPDTSLVRADPVLTERILLNLIHNAARHGGKAIALEVRRRGDRVEFAVIDDGPGIPATAARTIFEPFVGQRDHGGLGLGLGLSRGLAEAQGGALWLDTGEGHTRFVLALPVDERDVT